MKLLYSATSPFVRKVSIVLIETGLSDRVENVSTNPWDPQSDLPAQNPIGKVPTLISAQGVEIFDSSVICEFLDNLHAGSKMFPIDAEGRITANQFQSLADGMMDAAVLGFIENSRRPKDRRWGEWSDRQLAAITRSLNWLEERHQTLNQTSDIGTISVACALGYLDFRFADLEWRRHHERLAEWFEQFAQRESIRATAPV
ncbi:glutathione S-transferase N-terminal domain-containing protein [Gammaproteobacteria bacterium]|nr:glutathione S-transferase N-terminal domain-containing protein [Gammaproteobacteria bacterium]